MERPVCFNFGKDMRQSKTLRNSENNSIKIVHLNTLHTGWLDEEGSLP